MSKRYRSLILILSIAVMVFLSGYAVQPVYADETDNNPTVEENGGSNNSEPVPGPSSGGDSGSSSDSGGGSDSGSSNGDATPSDSGGSGSGSGGESSGGGDTNTGGESTPGGGTNTGGENTPGDDNTPGDENTPGDQPSAGGENTPGEGTTPGGTTGDNSGQSGQNDQSGSGITTESSTVLKESKPSQDITDLPATVDPGSATLKETAKSGSDSNTAAGTKYTNSADAISPAQATSGLGTEAGKDGNAIQRAVTAALKNATAETTVITVTVDEGEYNGDIKIAKPEASTEGESSQAVSLNSDLKVYILGKGSYTEPESGMIDKTKITAGAGANARVNGNILIDGINVVLAGLYYSLETKINVKNADATIYGTKSEDNITVNLDGKSTTTIDGGDASDIITLTGSRKESGQAAALKGGNGDDIYNVKLIDKTAEESAPQDQQPATITSNITIEDSDKYGILVLDGKLSTTAENRLKVEEANGTYTITAINEAGHTTVIKATGLKGLSDTLANKETVEVSLQEARQGFELEPYKDYVVKSLLLPQITAKKKDSSATLYFTNVVLTYDDWISKVAKKDLDFKFLDTWGANVPDANVLIKGRDIRIRGDIKAKIVNIIAEDKTEEITDVYSKTKDGDMYDMWTHVWNMYRGSSIKVMEGVTIEAEYVLMNVTQTADISKTISLMQKHQSETDQNNNSGSEGGDSGFGNNQQQTENKAKDYVLIQHDSAVIVIEGWVKATVGSVWGTAKVLLKEEVPNGAGFNGRLLIGRPQIEIGEKGSITAEKDVNLTAYSNLTSSSVADESSSYPAAIDFAFIFNRAHVENKGALKSGTNMNLKTQATTDVKMVSHKGANKDGAQKLSVFATLGLIFTDIYTSIEGSGWADAGGYLNIISEDNLKLNALAEATYTVNAQGLSVQKSNTTITNALNGAQNGPTANEQNNSYIQEINNAVHGSSNDSNNASSGNADPENAGAPDPVTPSTDGNDSDRNNLFNTEDTNTNPTGEEGITRMFDDSAQQQQTSQSGDTSVDTTTKLSDQMLGAITAVFLKDKNNAFIKTKGTVKTADKLTLLARATGSVILLADATKITKEAVQQTTNPFQTGGNTPEGGNNPGSGQQTNKVMGGALVLTYGNRSNQAYIDKGTVEAKTLEVQALGGYESSPVNFGAGALAGYTTATTALAGSVVFAWNSFTNKAIIGKEAKIKAADDSELLVNAKAFTRFTTMTNSTGVQSTRKNTVETGAGGGLSVTVNGADVFAGINDGAAITGKPKNVNVTASQKGDSITYARAGTSGKNAYGINIAFDVSGFDTQAYIGKLADDAVLEAAENINVTATNNENRQMAADASQAGDKVGLGGDLAMTYYNDKTIAGTKASMKAKNINVNATAQNKAKATARASARGTASTRSSSGSGTTASGTEGDGSDGEADQIADGAAAPTLNMAGRTGLTGTNPTTLNNQAANRQKAKTSEGSIEIAAALLINNFYNITESYIADAGSVTAEEDINVLGFNETDAITLASGEAVNSDKGVGVAVAIDHPHYENNVYVSARKVTARNLNVLAQVEKAKAEGDTTPKAAHDGKATAISGAGAVDVGVAGSLAMEFMDGTTRAYVANNDKDQTLNISGKLNVKAIDNNNIETIATATVNADGSPATNMAAVRTNTYEKKTQDKITVNATENGTAAINKESDGSYTITVTPDSGFELDTIKGLKTQVGSADEGTEDASLLTAVEGKTNVYKIEKAKIDALGENDTITVKVTFKGTRHKVTLGEEFKNYIQQSMLSQDKVFLTYEDNIITTGSVEARQADAVYVTIAPNSGFKIQDGSLYYSKADGSEKTPISIKDTGANDTYAFFVPGNDVVIHATLIRADTQGRARNADGKGIGVGAAIIFSNIDYVTEAYIGKRVTAEAGSADIIADHTEKRLNAAVAGTDPMNTPAGMSNAGRTPTVNNVSVDAAVIIVFDEADVSAGVNDGAKITTKDSGNLTIHGTSTTDTKSEASGCAAGDQTAVGATVVVNFAESEIKAFMDGTANIGGNLDLKGYTYDQDIANAVATAIGADIARYLGKFNQGTSDLTTRVNDFLSGKKSTEKKTNLKNETAAQINNKIGSRASEGAQTNENGSTTSNGQSTSSNVLNTRNVTTDGAGNETVRNSTNEVSDTVRNNTDENQASAPTTQEKEKTKVMAAAAISWNMVEHNITVRMQGNVEKAAKVDINAENKSDFRAYATAAAVSLSKVDYMVAAGVALMDNDNDTHIIIGRDGEDAPHSKINASGDITIESRLTENMDGKFKGWLGAQALAGSISKEAKLSVSGAVAYLGSEANTDILIHEGAEIKSSGADSKIKINAQDKSKLAIRAGNAQGSKGNKNAAGVSIAIIWADNNVIVQTMPNVVIEAGTVDVTATKLKVDKDDFTNQVSWSNLVTKDNKDGKTGLIDIKSKNKDGNNSNNKTTYSVSTSLTTNRLLELVDVLNFLTSNNYYAEAISGALAIGDNGNFLGVGSVAMVFEDTNTYVEIGNENTIRSTKGDISLKAKADTTARTIAGAVAAGKSATAAGAGISVVSTDNVVRVNLGTKDNIESAAAYTQSAESIDDSLVITAEAAVNAKDSGRSYGASVSIVLNGNLVESNVGAQSKITAAKDINVSTKADHDLCNIAVGVQGGKGAALGGTILFQKTTGQTYTYVGDQAVLTSTSGNINLTADTVEKMVAVLASASVSKDVGAAAATVFVPIAKSVASVTTDDVTLKAKDIVLDANADTKVIGVNFNATVAGGTNGFGLSVAIAVFKHYVQAGIGQGSVVNASGNVAVRANAEELTVIVLGSAGYAKEAGVNGQIAVVVSDNLSKAIIGMYAPKEISTDEEANAVQVTKVTAGGSVYVNADLTTKDYLIVGGFTAASQDFAAGFTIAALKESNAADALINRLARITASVAANVDGWTDRKKKKHGKGLEINANHESSSILIAIPVAVGQGTSAAFALPIKIQKNRITSKVRSGAEVTVKKSAGTRQAVLLNALKADGSDDGKESDSEEGPAVTITATKNTFVFVLGGALSMSTSNNAIAPAVGVLTYKDTMEVTNESKLTTDFGVKIKADRDDDVDLFVVGIAGGSQMAIAGDISVLTFNNTTKVVVAKEIDAGGDVEIAAHSDVQTINAVGSVGVSMSSFAVAGALLVTYFKNVTTVDVNKMIKILTPGKVTIKADSDEDVYSFVINLAVSNGAGVALAAAVVYSEVETRATMGTSAQVGRSAASPVESFLLHAKDNYTNVTVSANAGVSTGGLAVAISGLVSTSYNTVTAKMDSKAKVYASGDAVVEALADRSINAFSAGISVAFGTVGAAVNANIVIAGAAMNDDAHKVVALDGGSNDTTPIQTFIDNAFSDKNTKAYIESEKPDTDLSETYKSDGTSAGSDMNLGKNDKGEYDGSNYSKDLAAKEGETSSKDLSSEEAAKNIDSNVETLTGNVGEESSQALNRDGRVLKDAVTSTVNTKAEIHAGKDIKVLAAEQVAMRVISGTVGVGGTSGAAVGVTVAILYSNVEAVVNAAAVLDAGGNVIVHAESTTADRNLEKLGLSYEGKDYKSSDVDKQAEKGTEEKTDSDDATGDKDSNEKIKAQNNIFIISVNAGIGGVGGLAVSLSWLSVQSNVMAKVLGKVTAENLEVTTNLDYSKICNVNLGISVAGVGSAAAAITVTKFNGTHEAAIGGGAVITTSGTTKVSNNVNANLVAVTVVAAIAGQGAIAFNVTVGINRVRADAYVGEGVKLTAGQLDISNDVHAGNNVVTVNVAISGGGAGGVTVNVLINKPTALAYTGRTPVDEEGASDEKTADLNKIGLENKEDNIKAHSKSAVAGFLTVGSDTAAGEVNVSSTVTGKIHAVGVSVTAGLYGGVTGAVTVAKQASVNAAVVGGMPIKGAVAEHRPKMNVNAAIDGNVDATSVAVTVGGGVAIGVQVTVSSNTSHNTARIDLRNQTASVDEMNVQAGGRDEENKVKSSDLIATVGSGAVGLGVVSFNFAQGSNTSVNNAEILGNADTELTANKVDVYALGASKAKTDVYNVSIGGFSIAANIALSNQEAVQNARIYGIGSLQAESVKVTSEFNYNKPEEGKAEEINDSAYSLTCNPVAIGLVTITGSLSKANSDAATRAYMKGCGGTITNSTTVETTARSKATADIDTPVVTVSLGDIGVAVVNAHADGTAESFVDTTGAAETPSLGALTVTTDAIAKADSKTAPGAPFSLKVTLDSYSENMAMASASLKAASYVKGAFNAGDTTVTSNANAETDAAVKEANLQVSLENMAANQAEAKDLTENRAYIELTPGQKSTVNGKLKVTANTKGDAYAITGPGSKDFGFTLAMAAGAVNVSFACSETINLADIRTADGAEGSEGELEVTGDLELTANNKPSKAMAEANTGGSVSLVDSCGVYAESFVSDRNKAAIGDYTKVELTGNSANATLTGTSNATSTASSYAGGGASLKNGTKGSMAAFIGNRLESKPLATDREEAQSVEVGIGNGSTLTAPGVITLQANNTGSADSEIKSGLQGSAVASKDNSVPTYASFSTKVYTGEGAKVAGEKVKMEADGSHKGEATMAEKSLALGSGKGKSFTANFADIDTAVLVSDKSDISARSGIDAKADFLVDVYSDSEFWETSFYKGSDYNAWNKVNKNNAVQIGKEAKLTSETGTISLMAGNVHNDKIKAYAAGGGVQGVSNADFISRNYYAPESTVQTGQNAEIKVNKSGTIQLVASNGNADDEKADGRNRVHLEAYVNADIGSFWNATNSNTENTYKPKAEVRTYQTTIDATGEGEEGNVDIRATVGKQYIRSYADINSDIVTDLDTFNRSYIDTYSNLLLDGSTITGKADILAGTVNDAVGRGENMIESYTYVDGGCGAVAGKMYAGGVDQINVITSGSTFSNLNSNRKLYLSKKNNGLTRDYEEHMGARTNWLTRDKTDDSIKFKTGSGYSDRIRREDGSYVTKKSYSPKPGEVNLNALFGDAPKNASIENFNDKPYEKNDDLMGEMDMYMDKSALESIAAMVTNESLQIRFVLFEQTKVVGVAVLEAVTKDDRPAWKVKSEITNPAQVAVYIKDDFEHKAENAIRKKNALDNYLEADKYLAKLTFLGGSNRVYNELQKLLPANMSVTDWLRVQYGVAVYDNTNNTIIRRNEDEFGNARPGNKSVTNYNNGNTVSMIRKVARSKTEAKDLIKDTAGNDENAKKDLEDKVKQKKNSKGENYKNVDERLEDQYQGGDAQQDGKTWNGEDSGKGSDNYMWIWLLGIGLCLAAEYAVWKKRKEK